MWVKALLTLLGDTLWDKGHAGGSAMVVGCNVSWQNGAIGCVQDLCSVCRGPRTSAPWALRS